MTIEIIYDHHNRKSKDGTSPIEVRYDNGRKKYYINTGIKVLKENFVGGTIVNQDDAPELNERLSIIYRRIQEELNNYIKDGTEPNVAEIRRRAWQMTDKGTTILDFIEEQQAIMQLTSGTIHHYTTLRTRLREYGMLMKWSDLTTENIYKFDAWLHTLTREDGKPISDAAVYNYHKCLKAILNRALLFDKIDRNPYDRLKGKFRRGDKKRLEYLTDAEMSAVEAIRPLKNSHMAIVRDLFIFQLHTGLSFADTQSFDFGEYMEVNGKYINIGQRVKTGVEYVIQLSDECLSILKSYDYTLPKIKNSEYNRLLKYLGQVANIERPLHSHLARHSFATKMTASGAPLQNVAKMLGHTNITQTQRYAKVLVDDVLENFNNLNKKQS